MMRRFLSLVLLACLLAPGVRGQATADQLNKLSLEALTAPPPRGSIGGSSYSPSARHRPAWLPPRSNGHAGWRAPNPRYASRRPDWRAPRAAAPRNLTAQARYGSPSRAPRTAHRPSRYMPRFHRR